MPILLNDQGKCAIAKSIDYKYGPWTDTATAIAAIPLYQRYQGLTIGVVTGGVLTEYWFKNGILDADLITKTSSASSSGLPYDFLFNFNDLSSVTAFPNSLSTQLVLRTITFPAALTGSLAHAESAPTTNSTIFTVKVISASGAVQILCTVTFAQNSNTGVIASALSQDYVAAAGSRIQVLAVTGGTSFDTTISVVTIGITASVN